MSTILGRVRLKRPVLLECHPRPQCSLKPSFDSICEGFPTFSHEFILLFGVWDQEWVLEKSFESQSTQNDYPHLRLQCLQCRSPPIFTWSGTGFEPLQQDYRLEHVQCQERDCLLILEVWVIRSISVTLRQRNWWFFEVVAFHLPSQNESSSLVRDIYIQLDLSILKGEKASRAIFFKKWLTI